MKWLDLGSDLHNLTTNSPHVCGVSGGWPDTQSSLLIVFFLSTIDGEALGLEGEG